MGAITAYSICVAIIFAVEFGVFKCLLANCTFYSFNRRIIWGCYVMALFAVPVVHVFDGLFLGVSENVEMLIGVDDALIVETAVERTFSPIYYAIPIVYFTGLLFMLVRTLLSYCGMLRLIRSGSRIKLENATLVVVDGVVLPFSWGRYVVLSLRDVDNRVILEHELCHVKRGHSIDLFFAQMFVVFNWFNPVAYLMRGELSKVHEYEVDNEILISGVSVYEYQMLLIKKTVGSRYQSITNSLNHSQLKKRLTMMKKSKSKRGRTVSAIALLPAALLAVLVTEIPAVASTIRDVAKVSYDKSSEIIQSEQLEVSENRDGQPREWDERQHAPEIKPEYPGGIQALMNAIMSSIRYPEAPYKEGASGRTVVSFVVKKDGSISDIKLVKTSGYGDLDAEAMRAILEGATERWTPGRSKGEAIDCVYFVPVTFKLKR